MKKLLCAVLSGIMAFSTFAVAVPITASAAESQESVSATYGDFEYTLEDDYTCTITGYNGSAANVTIPSTIYGYKVSALSDTAFLSNKNIRSVIIPNGVLRIGALCFDSCTNLQEITIPDSVMHIVRSGDAGSGGFLQFCDSLKEITLGSGLENFFDTYDLNGSHSFECIDISKNNKYYCSIDGVAFSKDKKKLLKYPPAKKDEIYTIPDTVSKLSMPMGFTLNENLKAVIIPKSVKEISLYTFGTSLNSIYGYKGTVAETYAKENGFKFIEISEPTSVSLNKTSLTLDVSKSYTLTKTVSPSNAVTSYTWSSSNTRVATVDGNGKVTAKKAGTATITVKTANGKTASCNVTVQAVQAVPTSVSLNKTSLTLDVSKSYTLAKTVSPSNAVTSYTWSSSNTRVATVDGNGKVTAKKAGTATITVKTSNGKTATCKVTVNLPAPQITGLANTTGGIKISWNKIAGVYGYRLYYKTSSGGWKRFKDTTATSFTDSGVSPNRTETYTIRCIDKNGNTISGFNSTGWSKKYTPAAPTVSKLDITTGGIKLSWNKIAGVYGYRLYYKTSSGGWKRFKDTTATSFTDSGVSPNRTETYTIRCIDKNGNTVSGFNSNGWSKKYTPVAPTISKLENTSGGIKISWNKIAGVYGYRLYYKTSSGGWKRFKDTTATSFTDSGVSPNRTETYTIRCIDKNGKTVSGFNSKGWSKKYTPVAPTITRLSNTSKGVSVTWNKIAGVYGYRLYRKYDGGSWTKVKDTTSTSFTDSGAKKGKKVTYTVRCIDRKGKTVSGFNSKGWSITRK